MTQLQSQDHLQPFIFDQADIRGEYITLSDSYREATASRAYPTPIKRLLGEFLAASGLLSATLKFDGIISLQAQGSGPVSLIMADCTRHQNLRGIVQFTDSENFDSACSLSELTNNGTLAITIEPLKGERYQGLVPIESPTLAQNLEFYFKQSEQLQTRIWIASDNDQVSALMLQRLPDRQFTASENSEFWERIQQMASTVTEGELLHLPAQTLLFRLFNEEQVRLFDQKTLQFACSCSRQRTLKSLLALGEADARELLISQGEIQIDCQFCSQNYVFTGSDIDELFNPPPPPLH